MFVSPIFYMGSKKKLIKKGLISLFPKNIDTFYDIFGGSGVVSMNTTAQRHIINDLDSKLFEIYHMFKHADSNSIISIILKNIKHFQMTRHGVKQNTPESLIYKPRYVEMRKYCNKTGNIIDLYSCTFYAFSQQMRFNKKGGFNMPFGNGAFLKEHENKITEGSAFFHKDSVSILNMNFTDIDFTKIAENDFVYLDPPYLNSTATYNEKNGWTEENDQQLFTLCEELNRRNIRWGMSNVLQNKGITNKGLVEWIDKFNWNVVNFKDMTYFACGKGNSNAKEVYISNFSIE